MRPEIYFTSYALYFIEDLLYAPEDSGIYADCKSGISLEPVELSLVTRFQRDDCLEGYS